MDGVVREVNVRMFGRGFSLVNADDSEWKIIVIVMWGRKMCQATKAIWHYWGSRVR